MLVHGTGTSTQNNEERRGFARRADACVECRRNHFRRQRSRHTRAPGAVPAARANSLPERRSLFTRKIRAGPDTVLRSNSFRRKSSLLLHLPQSRPVVGGWTTARAWREAATALVRIAHAHAAQRRLDAETRLGRAFRHSRRRCHGADHFA